MTAYHISRIAHVLEQQFTGLIDLSDQERWKSDDESPFLTRALAALCIKAHTGISEIRAAASIVDGFDDGGIDAIYFDSEGDALYFVQTKWSKSGKKSLEPKDASKFVAGVRDVLAGDIEILNASVKKKKAEIYAALQSTRAVRVVLITAHTSSSDVSIHAKSVIEKLIKELNIPSIPPLGESIYYNQAKLFSLIISLAEERKINIQISLDWWGKIDVPFLSFYGRAKVAEIASIWHTYGKSLFSKNIRHYMRRTDVNSALIETLETQPESFWYLNNGITIICDKVEKTLVGAPKTEIGSFNCSGASIVNGAQTVGVIGGLFKSIDDIGNNDKCAPFITSFVHVRLISLERSPQGFDILIARAANLQNTVEYRDLAALDPKQRELALGFALERRRYAYKNGEEEPRGEDGCSITEATQALGCAESIDLAVQVKRSIGEIWRKIEDKPYKAIFNDKLTSSQVWRAILVMRAVESELQKHHGELVATHMNRVILHIVFKFDGIAPFYKDQSTTDDLVAAAKKATIDIYPKIVAYINEHHPKEYLGNFCKNAVKCKQLTDAILTNKSEIRSVEFRQDLLSWIDVGSGVRK